MIFVTGDCHGNFERFKPEYIPNQMQRKCGETAASSLVPFVQAFETRYVQKIIADKKASPSRLTDEYLLY